MTDQEPPVPEPLDETKPAPIDRYCDLVLTGGLTDGVVYPWAILELAREYRFKNIGGTSVGAMAAALTAAAEYARRGNDLTGFNEVLLKLPEKLAERVNGKTRLFSLFRPAQSTQRLFNLFVDLFSPDPGTKEKSAICRYGLPILRAYRQRALTGLGLGLLLGLIGVGVWCYLLLASGSTLTWTLVWVIAIQFLLLALPWVLVLALAFLLIGVCRDVVDGLVPNGFGLCSGGSAEGTPGDEKTLIEWLHEGIQAAAARKPLDPPLTFNDLWQAPGGPVTPAGQTKMPRSIDLRMFTTNLTHGRPHELPLDESSRLFFHPSEWIPYFPSEVLEYLVQQSVPYAPKLERADPETTSETEELRELPSGELPILVAARLSLSFPFLFSAVPLWAIDYEPRTKKERTLRRCWFSDGGICSNFPVHLFDAAIPRWPTFGIWLAPRSEKRKDEYTWLPKFHYEGLGDSWRRFDEECSPLRKLIGFTIGIFFSAKDWNDKASMRMPGVRDRVVHVALAKEDLGGLNLKLAGKDIMRLASEYGPPAGRALLRKFSGPNNRPSIAWNEHRWVRFNTFLVGLRERIEAITAATERTNYATPLFEQISDARGARPLSGEDEGAPLTPAQADDLEQLLAALWNLESKFAQADVSQPYKPVPTPSLRVRPPL